MLNGLFFQMDLDRSSKKGVPITVIGLPSAGKTTFVKYIKEGVFRRPKPTISLNFERIEINNNYYHIFDLSGHSEFRDTLWRSHVQTSIGIIFVVDTANVAAIDEAVFWYWKLIDEWLEGIFTDRVLLFLANKSDLKNSLSLELIFNKFQLSRMVDYPNISFQVFKTSIRSKDNVDYAFKWFLRKIDEMTTKKDIKPKALLLVDNLEQILHQYNPTNIFFDDELLSGFLKATSGFTNELLGDQKFKVIKAVENLYLISEEEGHLLILVSDKLEDLPELRRLSYLIQERIKEFIEETISLSEVKQFISELIE